MKVTLYCVGCGRAVCQVEAEERAVLAISCLCGAPAPILRGDDGSFAPPATLVTAVRLLSSPSVRLKPRGTSMPHLEYFLGYSDHESTVKTAVIEALHELGAISQADCPEEKCKRAYKRGRERWQRELQEQEALELQEQERHYRIMEIGEP